MRVQFPPMPPFMGYDYIKEHKVDVTLDDPNDVRPIGVVLSNISRDFRHVLEVHAVRDEKDLSVFHVTWKSLEHGVTY